MVPSAAELPPTYGVAELAPELAGPGEVVTLGGAVPLEPPSVPVGLPDEAMALKWTVGI